MADPQPRGPMGLKAARGRKRAGPAANAKAARKGPVGVVGSSRGVDLGSKVTTLVSRKLGRRVGDGECFALADLALKGAGAKSAEDFGVVTGDADYRWGTAVPLESVKPGDIVQFRDYGYVWREEKADGSWKEAREKRAHHTAIVLSVGGHGQITVIEQNVPKRGVVRKATLGFQNASFKKGDATFTTTVEGEVWFYRPQTS